MACLSNTSGSQKKSVCKNKNKGLYKKEDDWGMLNDEITSVAELRNELYYRALVIKSLKPPNEKIVKIKSNKKKSKRNRKK